MRPRAPRCHAGLIGKGLGEDVDPTHSGGIQALPPLRDEIAAAGLRASKALGQNFLLDMNLLDRIVRSIGLQPGDRVFEVGPGPGGLTRALLKTGAEVVAVERDSRAIPILQRLSAAAGGRLQLVEGDALAADARALAGEGAHIAANLPYNIGTLLLTRWLTEAQWLPWWKSATLMFQKEVADRLVAAPGTGAYGRLSVLAQLRADVRIETLLPARAFTPAPKVDSAVVRLVPKLPATPFRLPLVEQLTGAAFGQRRKMLRQSLKGVPGALDAMEKLGLDVTRRAETLSVTDFSSISQEMDEARACS